MLLVSRNELRWTRVDAVRGESSLALRRNCTNIIAACMRGMRACTQCLTQCTRGAGTEVSEATCACIPHAVMVK